MHKASKLIIFAITVWLIGFYGYALAIISMPKNGNIMEKLHVNSNNYWSPNPSLIKSDGGWDTRVWKWREFMGCGSIQIDNTANIHADWYDDNSIHLSMLTPPDSDWVYVAGISVGSVWDDLQPVYQPPPLKVSDVNSLILQTKIEDWRGAPLSPIIFPSWYAMLTDVWFNVKDVTIEDEGIVQTFPSKILGMDIFYHTMTGSLNVVMGGSNEFARIEPCNKNFIYSVNLSGQDFYTNEDGLFTVDLSALLLKAQEEAARLGWHFTIDNVELVMMENVLESYWSYAYAKINWSGIRYCMHEEECI